MHWTLVFCGISVLWGIFVFLQVVGLHVGQQELALQAQKRAVEDQAWRDGLLPLATATPAACELRPEVLSGRHS